MFLKTISVALTLACLAGELGAQQATANNSGPVPSGTRVRVTTPTLVAPLIANFLEKRGDTLVFIEDGTGRGVWSFDVDQIDRLESSGGQSGRSSSAIKKGALIGGLVGFTASLIFVNNFHPSDPERDYDAAPTTMIGAITGIGIGAFVGSRISTERWVSVPLPGKVALMPSRRGLSISFSLR